MTTSSPSLAQKLYEMGKERGIRVMDAPVSGGDSGARNATLSIMVGGDQKDFEDAMPLFSCMGKNIILMGPAGSGQHTKAANQIAVAGATAAYTEALIYAEKTGQMCIRDRAADRSKDASALQRPAFSAKGIQLLPQIV